MILYKYKSIEHLEDIIVNKRLYCSRFDKLNDPMEWAFKYNLDKEEINKLIQDTEKDKWRICCLSKADQYGLMWSMYGNEHKGVCVEVEVDVDENDDFVEYKKATNYDCSWLYGDIEYAAAPSKVNETTNHLKHVLWRKSKQWKHEEEVRFASLLKGNEVDKYLPVTIKCIYLGKRMKPEDKQYVKKLCEAFCIPCMCMLDPNAPYINYWKTKKNTRRKMKR